MNLASLSWPDLCVMPIHVVATTSGEQAGEARTQARLDENFGTCGAALAAERLPSIGKTRREVRLPAG